MDAQTSSQDFVTRAVLKEEFDVFAMQIVTMLAPKFKALEDRMDAFEAKLDHLTSTLDAFLKRLDDIEIDNQARNAQIARLERWIETIAQKTGVKLEY